MVGADQRIHTATIHRGNSATAMKTIRLPILVALLPATLLAGIANPLGPPYPVLGAGGSRFEHAKTGRFQQVANQQAWMMELSWVQGYFSARNVVGHEQKPLR